VAGILRCGVKDYEIKTKAGMFHAWPVFTFLPEGREGEREIISDINAFFRRGQSAGHQETGTDTDERLRDTHSIS